MPFTDNIGLPFNCGYCRTFVYECLPGKKVKTVKKAEKGSEDPKESSSTKSSEDQVVTAISDGKQCTSDNVACLSEDEHFRALFVGPHFVAASAYFDKVGTATVSLFERHVSKVKWAFKHGFRSIAPKYVSAFSTAKWKALPAAEKSRHSLSNCVASATQFEQLQRFQ